MVGLEDLKAKTFKSPLNKTLTKEQITETGSGRPPTLAEGVCMAQKSHNL